MATKNVQPNEPVAIVDGRYLLPMDAAVQMLALMAKATHVTREYRSGSGYVYKFSTQTVEISLSPLTVAQVAAMNLED
jgi:hypothetical protein